MRVLAEERITELPERPVLRDVARFEWFRRGDRPAGVWLVRQGPLHFALPITTGTKPAIADYLPAPHGLPGFVAPVEQSVPAGASYFELADGRIVAAADSADEIVPGADGRSLRATWRRLVTVGGKTGEWIEPGFEVTVAWRISGATLERTETLTAQRDVSIKRLSWLLSSSATSHTAVAASGGGIMLSGTDGALAAQTSGDLPLTASIRSVGDEPLGRGPRVPIPTHVTYEAKEIELRPAQSRSWTISLTASAPIERIGR